MFQTRRVLSVLVETRDRPSAENATDMTPHAWPTKIPTRCPVPHLDVGIDTAGHQLTTLRMKCQRSNAARMSGEHALSFRSDVPNMHAATDGSGGQRHAILQEERILIRMWVPYFHKVLTGAANNCPS